jgi:hypothetical protein
MTKTLNWAPGDVARPITAALLYLVAAALQAASAVLTRLAMSLSAVHEAVPASPQAVEFHTLYGEAGAPEGALYVNGKLVGTISGITRL